jgi:hypothetical protein
MKTAVLAAIACLACSHRVYSPPARTLPMDTPATMAPGNTALGFEVAGGGVAFSKTIWSGTANVTHGFLDRLEGTAEITYARDDFNSPAGTDTNAWATRIGAKYNILPRYLSAVGGVGVGSWAGGPFGSVDVGIVGGYENCYVVPFAAVRGAVSTPFSAHTVDTAQAGEAPGMYLATPSTTEMIAVQLGVKVPIGTCGQPPDFEIFAAGQAVHLYSSDGDDGGAQLAGGVRFTF